MSFINTVTASAADGSPPQALLDHGRTARSTLDIVEVEEGSLGGSVPFGRYAVVISLGNRPQHNLVA